MVRVTIQCRIYSNESRKFFGAPIVDVQRFPSQNSAIGIFRIPKYHSSTRACFDDYALDSRLVSTPMPKSITKPDKFSGLLTLAGSVGAPVWFVVIVLDAVDMVTRAAAKNF